jgi:N utilization substance protein B
MLNRRKSRELALQSLYAWESTGDEAAISDALEFAIEESQAPEETRDYAVSLVNKAISAQKTIDGLIQKHAANWDLKRMAAIDRNLLRLATAELMFFEKVPFKVVIDEAVEIAKTFGADDSGKFVNGLLDSIHKELAANQVS